MSVKKKYAKITYEGGIKSYVELLNENKEPIHQEPIYIHQTKDDIEVEIAIQYNWLCNKLINLRK